MEGQYLAHYGVKGMKWGVRKDRYKQMSFKERRRAKADYRVKKHGKGLAVGASLLGGTRGTAATVLTGVGLAAIDSLSGNNPTVRKGTDAVANLLALGMGVDRLIDTAYTITSDQKKQRS